MFALKGELGDNRDNARKRVWEDSTYTQLAPKTMQKDIEKYRFVQKACGNVIYVSEYDRMHFKIPLRGQRNRASADVPDKKTREDSIKRARRQIFSIVEGNFNNYKLPVFCTLSYEKNILEIGDAVSDFRLFLRKYSRDIFGRENALRYIAVAERQEKRGAKSGDAGTVHFHFVLFNLPVAVVQSDISITAKRKILSAKKKKETGRGWTFEEFLELPQQYFTSLDIWGLGFSDMRLLDKTLNGKPIERVGAYVAKYLGKDNIHRFGRWNYLASRSLLRPEVSFSELSPDVRGDIMEVQTIETMGRKLKITKFVL
jgi:hypothetical protein